MSEARYERPSYVPSLYVESHQHGFQLWSQDGRGASICGIVSRAREDLEQLLAYRLRRALHVVIYASNEDARASLNRPISPTALLAPLHTRDLALIAVQSDLVDPLNGEARRMLRHVSHELGHAFVADRSDSMKRLGDSGVGMRVASWVDEGLSECVASIVAKRDDIILTAIARSSGGDMADEVLDLTLQDLDSPRRAVAFATATSRVWRAIQRVGLEYVFSHLSHPDTWRD